MLFRDMLRMGYMLAVSTSLLAISQAGCERDLLSQLRKLDNLYLERLEQNRDRVTAGEAKLPLLTATEVRRMLGADPELSMTMKQFGIFMQEREGEEHSRRVTRFISQTYAWRRESEGLPKEEVGPFADCQIWVYFWEEPFDATFGIQGGATRWRRKYKASYYLVFDKSTLAVIDLVPREIDALLFEVGDHQ